MRLTPRLLRHLAPPRVRFAPSPTGQLHLGGFRTALVNYLFAKQNNGAFVLRIEDTDQERLVPGAAEKLETMLEWMGTVPDESPLRGGDFGPYVQSQRTGLYAEHVAQLIDNGSAYRCFCTEKRLDLLRRESLRARQPNRYDRRCLSLSEAEVRDKMAAGVPYTVRLKLRPFPEPFDDVIFGPVRHDVFEQEGDPIIVKSDGFPTYHLANVVDDHLMEISHVLRGVEWQVSTPKHIMLYEAFGWEPPKFGHLPLIMNKDGTKLSKRQGDIHIEYYKEQGYLPEAVLNFITMVGGGFHDRDHTSDVVYTMPDFVRKFDLGTVNTNSSKIELERLDDFNRSVLKDKLSRPTEKEKLLSFVRETIVEEFGACEVSEHDLERHLRFAVDRITFIYDIVGPDLRFLWSTPVLTESQCLDLDASLLSDAGQVISENKDVKLTLNALRSLSKKRKVKFPQVMKVMRLVLSGLDEGPPVGEMIQLLGNEKAAERIASAVNQIEKNSDMTAMKE